MVVVHVQLEIQLVIEILGDKKDMDKIVVIIQVEHEHQNFMVLNVKLEVYMYLEVYLDVYQVFLLLYMIIFCDLYFCY